MVAVITRDGASAVDLLADVVERIAASERAAEARHAELMARLDDVQDAAVCTGLDVDALTRRLREALGDYDVYGDPADDDED